MEERPPDMKRSCEYIKAYKEGKRRPPSVSSLTYLRKRAGLQGTEESLSDAFGDET
jgi:hypothetical protein